MAFPDRVPGVADIVGSLQERAECATPRTFPEWTPETDPGTELLPDRLKEDGIATYTVGNKRIRRRTSLVRIYARTIGLLHT